MCSPEPECRTALLNTSVTATSSFAHWSGDIRSPAKSQARRRACGTDAGSGARRCTRAPSRSETAVVTLASVWRRRRGRQLCALPLADGRLGGGGGGHVPRVVIPSLEQD